jgi:hypothetical protein
VDLRSTTPTLKHTEVERGRDNKIDGVWSSLRCVGRVYGVWSGLWGVVEFMGCGRVYGVWSSLWGVVGFMARGRVLWAPGRVYGGPRKLTLLNAIYL